MQRHREIAIRLAKRNAILHAADHAPIVRGVARVLLVDLAWIPHVGAGGKLLALAQHADHRHRLAIGDERRADGPRRRAEATHPQVMTDHDGHWRTELLLLGHEQPADHGLRLQHVEELRRHRGRANSLDLAVIDDRHPALRVLGHRREAPCVGGDGVERRIGEREMVALRVESPELYHLLGASEGQRAQHHSVHDAEDGRGGPDAEGESECRDEREAGRLAEQSQREAEVLHY